MLQFMDELEQSAKLRITPYALTLIVSGLTTWAIGAEFGLNMNQSLFSFFGVYIVLLVPVRLMLDKVNDEDNTATMPIVAVSQKALPAGKTVLTTGKTKIENGKALLSGVFDKRTKKSQISDDMLSLLDATHLFILGGTGTGKTVFLTYLMVEAVNKGGQYVVIDGKPVDFENKWPDASHKVTHTDDYMTLLEAVQGEMETRINSGKHIFNDLWLLIDEASKITGANKDAVTICHDIAQRGREVSVHLILASQVGTVESIGFQGIANTLNVNFDSYKLTKEPGEVYTFTYSRFVSGELRPTGDQCIVPYLNDYWLPPLEERQKYTGSFVFEPNQIGYETIQQAFEDDMEEVDTDYLDEQDDYVITPPSYLTGNGHVQRSDNGRLAGVVLDVEPAEKLTEKSGSRYPQPKDGYGDDLFSLYLFENDKNRDASLFDSFVYGLGELEIPDYLVSMLCAVVLDDTTASEYTKQVRQNGVILGSYHLPVGFVTVISALLDYGESINNVSNLFFDNKGRGSLRVIKEIKGNM